MYAIVRNAVLDQSSSLPPASARRSLAPPAPPTRLLPTSELSPRAEPHTNCFEPVADQIDAAVDALDTRVRIRMAPAAAMPRLLQLRSCVRPQQETHVVG